MADRNTQNRLMISGSSMESSRHVAVQSAVRRLGLLIAFCGLSAVVLIALGWSGLIFVLGGVVIPIWGISVVLGVTSIALALFDRRIRAKLNDQGGLRETSRPRVFAVKALISLGVTGCVLAMLGDAAYSATYTVLTPAGSDGCQAVVRETSFFMAGQGEVYAVHRSGIGWRTGSWTADDGARPIESGQYELSWGTGGTLVVQGDGNDSVWPALHDVECF